MRNIVFLLFLGLCAFVVIGWFLDWYTIAGLTSPNGGTKVQIELNTNKIKDDIEKGVEKGKEAWEQRDTSTTPATKPEPIISMPKNGRLP